MDRGFDEARSLISYFASAKPGQPSSSRAGMVGDVLTVARNIIGDAAGFFAGMEESDQVSFQSINGGIQNLSLLDERLMAIREDSSEMELISLNAMTVALKAGQAGRAFSVITEELKVLSTETIGHTEKLTGEGRKILDLFRSFRSVIERMQQFQQSFYAGFRSRLEESFESFNLGVAKMAEILLEVIEEAGTTRKPLIRIMEEIQNQDIIRQSTQHVVLALSGVDGRPATAPAGRLGGPQEITDERLDEIAMAALLPELTSSLLKDVRENLSNGVTIFRDSMRALRRQLENAGQELQTFIDYFGTGENALERIFEESIQGMSGLLTSVEQSMSEKAKLAPEGNKILEQLKLLQESFEEFSTFVDRFRTIDIAARIELAKQEVLRAKRETMGSLTALAGRIGGDVKSALDIILETIERIESTIRRFGTDVHREASHVASLVETIRGVYAQLTESKDYLSHTMSEFSLFTKRFFSLLDELDGQVSELGDLVQGVGGIVEDLAGLGGELSERREKALAARGLTSWSIRDPRLREMIEKFTILSHKKAAADIGGLTVEEGGRPGELTLF
jgi:methyl-accepting chemotaxis protein